MKEIFKYKKFMRVYIANLNSRFGDSIDMIAFGYLIIEEGEAMGM